MLVKGGVINLAILMGGCIWLFILPLRAVTAGERSMQSKALLGIGLMLLSFWPSFIVVNLIGEEMFTDNLQLHWTMLFGLLLGLLSISQSMSKSSRAAQTLSS